MHGFGSVFGTRKAVVMVHLTSSVGLLHVFLLLLFGYCAFQQQSAVHRNTMTENLLLLDCISGE